ncbi:MAG: hypothetical protein ACREVA_03410, partial [Burkholderiales bacterium]
FVVVGCAFSLVIGVWMLLKPESVLRLNQYLSKWFGTEKLAAALDAPHSIEVALYRRHRSVGVLVLAGGLYILYVMLFAFSKKAGGELSYGLNPQIAAWLTDALGVVLVLSSVLGLVIGFFLVVRPSVFKPVEEWGNKWYATDKPLRAMEAMHLKPDEAMIRNYRIVAALVIAGSLYVLLSFWVVLF